MCRLVMLLLAAAPGAGDDDAAGDDDDGAVGDGDVADSICPQANAMDLDAIVKNLDLDAFRIGCR